MKRMKSILTFLFVVFLSRVVSFAHFEDTPVGARISGLNNSGVALGDDVYTSYANPAGLANLEGIEVGFDYNKLHWGLSDGSDLASNIIVYAQKFDKIGTALIGYRQFGLPNYYTENNYTLGFGRKVISESINFGVKIKALTKSYGRTRYTENAVDIRSGNTLGGVDPVFTSGYSKTNIGLDIGVIYSFYKNHSAGLSFENINQPDMGLLSKDVVCPAIKTGYAWKMSDIKIAVDVTLKNNDNTFSSGVEKEIALVDKNKIMVRGGLSFGSRDYANAAVGLSYKYNRVFQIDYGFNYLLRGIADTRGSHQLSLTLKFLQYPPEGKVKEDEISQLKSQLEKLANEKELLERQIREKEIMATSTPTIKESDETAKRLKVAEEKIRQLTKELEELKAREKLETSTRERYRKVLQEYWASGESAYKKGDYSQALVFFEKILQIEPEHQPSKKMIKIIEEIKKDKKIKAEKSFTLGIRCYGEGRLLEAIKHLEEALALDPENEEIQNTLNRIKKEIKIR